MRRDAFIAVLGGPAAWPMSAFLVASLLLVVSAAPQPVSPGGAPAVGVVRAKRQQIIQTDEFIGRIQAVGRVALVARVTAFLEKRLFVEGSEVKQGDLLYLLEQAPFQAQVDANKANVEQLEAQHRNAEVTLERAQTLLKGPAGLQATVDSALASERALAAQIAGAQAQQRESEINLGYTEIRAPIDGKISSTAVTEGNVVSPTSGTLATLVSHAVVIKLRLPDGRIYEEDGKLDYASPTVGENTDTVTLRGIIGNTVFPGMEVGTPGSRQLVDGEFVTVLLEGVQPIFVLAVPRAAVLSDQQGDYVYVVDAQNKAEIRRIQLGQSTPSTAVVTNGLKEGELVVSEGLQRVRPGEAVLPGPANPPPEVGRGGASFGAGEPSNGARPSSPASSANPPPSQPPASGK
jgi:membrane fusion protein, multidrug efflux system